MNTCLSWYHQRGIRGGSTLSPPEPGDGGLLTPPPPSLSSSSSLLLLQVLENPSLSLRLGDIRVYEHYIRARLGDHNTPSLSLLVPPVRQAAGRGAKFVIGRRGGGNTGYEPPQHSFCSEAAYRSACTVGW